MNGKEFIKALDNVVKEKNISKDIIIEAMEAGLVAAYKKNFNALTNVRVSINEETGDIKVYSFITVVDEVEDEQTEITLEEARKKIANINVGETIEEEVTPKEFGRVAAGTAKQIVIQKIKEAEKNNIIEEYSDKEQELMVGTLSREDAKNYYVDLGHIHGVLPKSEIIPGEKLEMESSIKVYVSKVEVSSKGTFILLTRNHYGFVKKLLELEVPEIAEGTIIIHSIARDAGNRSKVAVSSINSNVDPVGAIVGTRSSRLSRIIKQLNGEKLDIIIYDEKPEIFIANALSPAKNIKIVLKDDKKQEALAIVGEDELSLCIGKKGNNVKLASRLTKYKIDVKTKKQLEENENK
ncbi:MAG: transcription termination factor NusA [bacterium]|nr:transcription termination factor NusA [bacterium]